MKIHFRNSSDENCFYSKYWVPRSSLFEKLKLKFFDIFIPFIQPLLLFENQIHSTIRMKKNEWEIGMGRNRWDGNTSFIRIHHFFCQYHSYDHHRYYDYCRLHTLVGNNSFLSNDFLDYCCSIEKIVIWLTMRPWY